MKVYCWNQIASYLDHGFVKIHVSSTAHFTINLNGQINFYQSTQTALQTLQLFWRLQALTTFTFKQSFIMYNHIFIHIIKLRKSPIYRKKIQYHNIYEEVIDQKHWLKKKVYIKPFYMLNSLFRFGLTWNNLSKHFERILLSFYSHVVT